jgi:heme exporter protein C
MIDRIDRFERVDAWFSRGRLQVLAGLAVVGMLVAGLLIVLVPADALQGPVQKIFYLHLSTVLSAYYCFALTVAGSAWYLWRGSERADRLARAGATTGLVLTVTCIALGIVWAKPIWNWDPTETWDARFTSTVVLAVMYSGSLLVRKFAPAGRTAMRLSAVVSILAFIDVPVVYFSVDWWRTLHPGPVVERGALPPAMLVTFLVTFGATLLLSAVLVAIRYRIESVRDARDAELASGVLNPLSGRST